MERLREDWERGWRDGAADQGDRKRDSCDQIKQNKDEYKELSRKASRKRGFQVSEGIVHTHRSLKRWMWGCSGRSSAEKVNERQSRRRVRQIWAGVTAHDWRFTGVLEQFEADGN